MARPPLADTAVIQAADGRIFDARAFTESDTLDEQAGDVLPHEAVHVVQDGADTTDAIPAASDDAIDAEGAESGRDDDTRSGRQAQANLSAQQAAQSAAQTTASTTTDPDETGREATIAPAQKQPETQPDPLPEPATIKDETPDAPVNPYLTPDDPADTPDTGDATADDAVSE